MEQELVRMEGSVAAVVFQNAENGYTVLRLKDGQGEQLTVVGIVPDTSIGERLRIEGRWANHSTYGRQLEIVTLERLMPESRIEILAYLSSHAIRGIGPKIAARIVERFGADSLKVIENEPDKLAQVPGISAAKAQEIHESFQSQQGLRHLAEVLASSRPPRRSGGPGLQGLRGAVHDGDPGQSLFSDGRGLRRSLHPGGRLRPGAGLRRRR